MTEVLYLVTYEVTFAWLQLQSSITNPLNDITQVLEMVLEATRKHKNIVDVNDHIVWAIPRIQSGQHPFHQPLENSWGICEPKRHQLKFM